MPSPNCFCQLGEKAASLYEACKESFTQGVKARPETKIRQLEIVERIYSVQTEGRFNNAAWSLNKPGPPASQMTGVLVETVTANKIEILVSNRMKQWKNRLNHRYLIKH